MAFKTTPSDIINLPTYKEYMREIGMVPSHELKKCFDCGLPAVWLYLKAIGLEQTYFEILNRLKNRHLLFKEVFYLLYFTNGKNNFFPHMPENFLKLEIPANIQAAQIPMLGPEFELAYAFTKGQLKETLALLLKPGKMLRLGNKNMAIGVMYHDNVYDLYHVGNPHAVQFNSIDGCVDLIIRVMAKNTIPLIIQVNDINPQNVNKYNFTADKMLQNLLQQAPLDRENLQQILKFTVDASLPIEHLRHLIANGGDINYTYAGVIKLLHLAWSRMQENNAHAKEIFNFLLENGATLTEKEQLFFKDVDPKFVSDYQKHATPHNIGIKSPDLKH